MGRVKATFIAIIFLLPLAFADDAAVIPEDKAGLEGWFQQNVGNLSGRAIDPPLVAAELKKRVINMKADGSGDFKTIVDAIASIPKGNTARVVISLGGGVYDERININRYQPFITFLGDANNMPILTSNGTSLQYTVSESATLIVHSDYFSAVNVIFRNTAPRPDGIMKDAQAAALRLAGDKASLYNCRILGFQDTLCDNRGQHFFKDCYIEGTIDFIFGSGKSLYLNNELHAIPGDKAAVIAAHKRISNNEDTGFSFVHCNVTGGVGIAYLGRAWYPYPVVAYSYTEMGEALQKEGFSNNKNAKNNATVNFYEYKNKGVGSDMAGRAKFVKTLGDVEAQRFTSLAFIAGSSWLLPPTTLPPPTLPPTTLPPTALPPTALPPTTLPSKTL